MTYNIFVRGESMVAANCDRIRFTLFGVWGRNEDEHKVWTFIPWRQLAEIDRFKEGIKW